VSCRNTMPRGLLKITMPTTFGRLHIAPHLGKFLASYPDIELDTHLTDRFIDIIREGFDLAIRIGELEDSSLVGEEQVRTNGSLRSNSGEFIREVMLAGLGLGLRSTWDIGAELESGKLMVVLPHYCGSSNMAIYAVYPCREFMPAKDNVVIEFLADLYGSEPYWDKGLDLAKPAPKRAAARGGEGKRVAAAR